MSAPLDARMSVRKSNVDVRGVMYKSVCLALAVATAGAAAAQEKRPDPKDPKAKAPEAQGERK